MGETGFSGCVQEITQVMIISELENACIMRGHFLSIHRNLKIPM